MGARRIFRRGSAGSVVDGAVVGGAWWSGWAGARRGSGGRPRRGGAVGGRCRGVGVRAGSGSGGLEWARPRLRRRGWLGFVGVVGVDLSICRRPIPAMRSSSFRVRRRPSAGRAWRPRLGGPRAAGSLRGAAVGKWSSRKLTMRIVPSVSGSLRGVPGRFEAAFGGDLSLRRWRLVGGGSATPTIVWFSVGGARGAVAPTWIWCGPVAVHVELDGVAAARPSWPGRSPGRTVGAGPGGRPSRSRCRPRPRPRWTRCRDGQALGLDDARCPARRW